MVISGDEGLVKPQREIYDLLRERIGLPASELCFIDDLEKNINAGEEVAKKAARTALQNTCTGIRKAL